MLRIEAVELVHIELVLNTVYESSTWKTQRRPLVLVKVLADGIYGWGEVSALPHPGYSPETLVTAWHVLGDFLIPSVLGQTINHPSEVAGLYRFVRGHHFAKAGLENAVWDAFARSQGVPLAKVLGGVRDRVEAGIGFGIESTPDGLVRVVDGYVRQGYKRLKFKIKPGHDLEYLRAVRRAFPNQTLIADSNGAYTLDDLPALQALDEIGLFALEQPLAWDDIIDHARLQKAIRTPIALDESIQTPADARKALELDACRAIVIKTGRVGGHQAAIAVHDQMHARGLPVWCGGMFESGVGRAHLIHLSTLPAFTVPGDPSASDRYYAEDIVDEPAVLNADATFTVSTRPGIGVEVLPDQLKRCTLRTQSFRA